MDNAASNGYLDIVKWLHVNRSEGCTYAAMDRAAANGHLDVLKWLHDNRSEGCTADAMDNAAASGDFKMVKWFLANRSESVAFTALVKAAKTGHLRLVRYLAPHCAPRELELGVREALNDERFEVVLFLYSLSLNCGDGIGIQSVLSRAALHFQDDTELRHWIDEKTK
ncbi:putative ankyrin repeat protein L62 [Phytophthora citrophthora]|uniref:Ankyrin repeat protein L62 n=1 Tax=Phytophthora citrophthora TaxID=4793 RepID=A0AAD9GT79_9STRA|nr:putative ankyrin repeat protein L62 [Phytophthora citrophthora]